MKLLTLILLFLYLIPQPLLSQEKFTPKPEAKSSEYFDGPYILYKEKGYQIIKTIEDYGRMKLVNSFLNKKELVNVYKSGINPINFNVEIKDIFKIEPANYEEQNKIFALSDIEGNFNTYTNLLIKQKVIDKNNKWIFGKGHLVIIGDVFDRGNHQTELLWLIYNLEKEAINAGGKVHLLLGNHETMNMQGDIRYVENKYLVLDSLSQQELKKSYKELINKNSVLGRWLRSKNVIEKIGKYIFVHAGLSPKLMESNLSINETNNYIRLAIDKDKKDYNKIDSLLMKRNGPLWYRGYFTDKHYEPASNDDVSNILKHYNAKMIIVGHTRFPKPTFHFDGKVLGINVNPPQDHNYIKPPRKSFGILIENDAIFSVDGKGNKVKLNNN